MTTSLMPSVAISGIAIRQDAEGRYSLNDLHRAAGGEKRHQPSDWLRLQQTQDLVAELGKESDTGIPGSLLSPIMAIKGNRSDGVPQGTYVCKELVYAYAMWISAAFNLKVIRTFDTVVVRGGAAPPVPAQFKIKMAIARAAASMLRMSQTSKARMLAQIAVSEGLQPEFLPSYVDESLTRAMTALLREAGSPLASKVASLVNPALEEMGLLEHLERTGSRGDTKRFWSLTRAGLEYGRNETSPQNPRETQPLYYAEKFPDLLARIEAHIQAHPRVKLTVIRPEDATDD